MTSLYSCALDVLTTSNVFVKAKKTEEYVKQWQKGEIMNVTPEVLTDHPSWPDVPQGHSPADFRFQNGKWNGTGSKKIAKFIHGVMHAEGYAIDLMWDIIGRFIYYNLPRAFYDDWVRVAGEEARHFIRWADRFQELTDMTYGSFPVHDGLWQSALDTKNNLVARLVVVHGVHEARGLDVYPKAWKKLENDSISKTILEENYAEEVTHVAAAMKWFHYLCEKNDEDPVQLFHDTVRKYFTGELLPPFNQSARSKANMPSEYYLPLAKKL